MSHANGDADMPALPATDTSPDPEPRGYLEGRGAFGKVPDMIVGRSYPLRFVVGPTDDDIKDETVGVEMLGSQSVEVAPVMRVTLTPDPNFQFSPATDDLQKTGPDLSATWQWNIVPLRDGEHTLSARVEVLRPKEGGGYEVIETKPRYVKIDVEVGTWQGFMIALQNAASAGDLFTTLFNSWGKTLTALAALIGTIFGIPIAIREGMKRLRAKA